MNKPPNLISISDNYIVYSNSPSNLVEVKKYTFPLSNPFFFPFKVSFYHLHFFIVQISCYEENNRLKYQRFLTTNGVVTCLHVYLNFLFVGLNDGSLLLYTLSESSNRNKDIADSPFTDLGTNIVFSFFYWLIYICI